MKKGSVITGIVLIGCLFIFGAIASASSSQQESIQAVIDNSLILKINNGVFIPKENDGTEIKPIIYNGHTYLPVRAVASISGYDVDYDESTNTVILNSKDVNTTPFKDSKQFNGNNGSSTPTPEPTLTPAPVPTPTPVPTYRPEPTPTPTPTYRPEPTPIPTPTYKPEPTPIPTPTPAPTYRPEPTPTSTPTPIPTTDSNASGDYSNTKVYRYLSQIPEYSKLVMHDGRLPQENDLNQISSKIFETVAAYDKLPEQIRKKVESIKQANPSDNGYYIFESPAKEVIGYAEKNGKPVACAVNVTINVSPKNSHDILGTAGPFTFVFYKNEYGYWYFSKVLFQ